MQNTNGLCCLYAKSQNTIDFFKEKVRKYKQIIKQLLNSVLVGYEELLRPRFVLSTSAFGFGR